MFENLLRHLVILSRSLQLLVLLRFFRTQLMVLLFLREQGHVLMLKLLVGGCSLFKFLNELIVLLLQNLVYLLICIPVLDARIQISGTLSFLLHH